MKTKILKSIKPCFVAGMLLVCKVLQAQGGKQEAPLPLAVQKSSGAVAYITIEESLPEDGRFGFFINQDTLVSSIDLVKQEDKILNPKYLKLHGMQGHLYSIDEYDPLSSVEVVGYRSFSEVLGLVVMTVKGYEGPQLSLSHLSGIQTRSAEVYLHAMNFATQEGEMLTGQVRFSESDYHIYDGTQKELLVSGSPLLSSSGDVLAVSLKDHEHRVLAVPVSFVKDLLSTDFQWKSLNHVKDVPQRIKETDKALKEKYKILGSKDSKKEYLFRNLEYIEAREVIPSKDIKPYVSSLMLGTDSGLTPMNQTTGEKDFLSDFLQEESSQSFVNLFRYATYLEIKNFEQTLTAMPQGLEIKEDYFEKALVLYEQAARHGHTPSQARLGRIHSDAALMVYRVEKNDNSTKPGEELFNKAKPWLEKAALSGHGDSQFFLARLLAVYTEDIDLIRHWYEKAALNNSLEAQYLLHLMLMDEVLMADSEEEKSFFSDAARRWMKQMMNAGYPPALFVVFHAVYQTKASSKSISDLVSRIIAYPSYLTHYNSYWKQQENKSSGLSFLRKLVSSSGLPKDGKDVMFFMGQVFEKGFFSIPRSLQKARVHYRKAALKNHGAASFHLAESYRTSSSQWNHPDKEQELIKKWYQTAAKQGYKSSEARAAIKQIENQASKKRLAGLSGLAGALLCMPLFL